MAAYFRPKTIEYPEHNIKIKINLWDTAGQERFQSLTRQYIQSAAGVILVYDITDRASVEEAEAWYARLKDQIDPEQLVLAVIGNKSDDIDRAEVNNKDGKDLGLKVGAGVVMQVSAKTGSKCDQMFYDIGLQLLKKDPVSIFAPCNLFIKELYL